VPLVLQLLCGHHVRCCCLCTWQDKVLSAPTSCCLFCSANLRQHVLWWFVSIVQSVGHWWQMWTPDVCASVMEALDGKESWWRRLAYQIFFKSRHMLSVPFFPFCYLLCTWY
jgi:hypothetical protein